MTTPPDNPAGPFAPPAGRYDAAARDACVADIREAPASLREAVAGLTDAQLDTRYRNWTVRQIAQHIADSHVHSYIRFKWTLTEDNPTIKAYEEADWVALDDCRCGDLEPSLLLLDGLHAKWAQTLAAMSPEQFARTFVHPQTGDTVDLWTALHYYAWHGRHHTAQIAWLREQHNW